MGHLVNLIVEFGHYSYLILFLIIFFESFPLTFYLPGDSLLFTTGFLASQGYFNLGLLVTTLFIASVLGYIFSYVMGKKIRDFIINSNDRYWFKKKHLDQTAKFYDKYGHKTIIIGRFVPIVRSFAPTLAGSVEMPYGKFIRDVLVGGIIWTGGVTSLGYYIGRSIPSADHYLTPIILCIIFISMLPSAFEYLKSRKENAN